MKSKMKATSTISTTYVTTSGVLQGNARQSAGDVLTLIDSPLDHVVQLLPLDHFQRVRLAVEQTAHRLVVGCVALFFQPLDPRVRLHHQLRVLHARDRTLD